MLTPFICSPWNKLVLFKPKPFIVSSINFLVLELNVLTKYNQRNLGYCIRIEIIAVKMPKYIQIINAITATFSTVQQELIHTLFFLGNLKSTELYIAVSEF